MAELLEQEEVAKLLRVTAGCLAQWRFQKRGPAYVKVGRLVRYEKAALEDWLRDRRVEVGR